MKDPRKYWKVDEEEVKRVDKEWDEFGEDDGYFVKRNKGHSQ